MNILKSFLAVTLLAGTAYLPQANASNTIALGTITVGSDQSMWGTFFGSNPAAGAFDTFFTFTVNNSFSLYDLTGSVVTSSAVAVNKSDTFSSFALEDSVGNILEVGTVGFDGSGHATAYLPDDFWLANGDYKLELQGISSGNRANYGGSVSISAVPEAEEWAMLLLGLPLLSMAVRRQPV